MRIFLLVPAVVFAAVACTQSPPAAPRSLEEITWSNAATSDQPECLTLRPDHTYRIYDPRQAGNRNQTQQSGNYDVLSRTPDIILLDNRTPIRLSCKPNEPHPYRFTPFAFTPSAQIPPAARDQYAHLVDQYYAPKAFLDPHPGETPIPNWLP